MADALVRIGLVGEARDDVPVHVEYGLTAGRAVVPTDSVAVGAMAFVEQCFYCVQ